MRNFYGVGLGFAWLSSGCFSPKQVAPTRVARTSGSAVARSRAERIAVVSNRSQGSVSVVALSVQSGLTQARVVRSFDTGTDEPWAAVVGLDDDTAYVLFKNAQRVRRLTSLHGKPVLESD